MKKNLRLAGLIVAVVLLYLLHSLLAAAVVSAGVEGWGLAVLVAVAKLSNVLLLLGLGLVGVIVCIRLVQWVRPLLEETMIEETVVPADAAGILTALTDIGEALDLARQDRNAAVVELQAAEVQATVLVSLIRRMVAQAATLERGVEDLQQALDAVASGDRQRMAQAAGAVDAHLGSLLLESNGDEAYRADLAALIAGQVGSCRKQARTNRQMASAWTGVLGQYRMRTGNLRAGLHLADAVEPLVRLDAHLGEAEKALSAACAPRLPVAASGLSNMSLPVPQSADQAMLTEGYK